ncbi:hypothetical protein MAR_019481 [Mya arenaria]|uniref:Uncharacterized protein n=1 Tax=Mya arenaria TaxID=6604 RepID=A0ABY7E562_MYAAR|nr:hypothetical protein MAR_019481 [Mya arenaria]
MTLQAMKASSSTKQYCHNFNKNHTVGAIHSFRKSRFLALHIYEINIVSKSMLTELNGLVNYYGALVDEHLRSQYFGYLSIKFLIVCFAKNTIIASTARQFKRNVMQILTSFVFYTFNSCIQNIHMIYMFLLKCVR